MSTEGWFPIPVYVDKARGYEFDNIQKELLEIYSNIDFQQHPSWTSDTHELSMSEDGHFFFLCILTQKNAKLFLEFIHSHIKKYLNQVGVDSDRKYIITESWFTKTKKGKYAHLHDHGAYDISGVYYLKTNGKDGNLYFSNIHRSLASNYVMSKVATVTNPIPLENGIIALWPSMLLHNTEPNQTDHDRVSISFNIKFGYE